MLLSIHRNGLFKAIAIASPLRAGAVACLALVACDQSGKVVEHRKAWIPREVAPFSPPIPRVRSTNIQPETYRFLEAIGNMEEQIAELESSLVATQELYESYDFDAFLDLDPWTIDQDSLFYLSHFCDAGFFTVQRKVLLNLLERKLERKGNDALAELQAGNSKGLAQRLADAMFYREERIMDLDHVIHLYQTRQGAQEFLVPDYVAPEQLEAMRQEVADKLNRQRELVAELDGEINSLKAQYDAS